MNKKSWIIVAAVGVVCFIMGMLTMCNTPKPPKGDLVRSDTGKVVYVPRIDTVLKPVITYVPKPYRVDHFVDTNTKVIHDGNISKSNDDAGLLIFEDENKTISYYSDTLRQKGEFKAVIRDTVAGTLLGRSVWWADLTPIEQRTVTNTVLKKEPLVKVYLGLDAYAHTGSPFNADIAPAGSFVISDRYMVDLGYYVLHQQVTAGFKVKISFRK